MSDKPLDCVGIPAGKTAVGKHDFKFVAVAVNTGAVTERRRKTVTLKKNRVPIKAGDFEPGQIIEFDSDTGEVV